jgi:zinc transporter ZupT
VVGLLRDWCFKFFWSISRKGAEHGHAHVKENQGLPWLLLLSLGIHAFIEGLPLSNQNELLWGIFVHKIPIGMVVFFLVWETRVATFTKVSTLFLFALMSPLGSFLNDYSPLLQVWQFQITSVVIGMLFHIATTILFESNQGHAFNLRKLLTILLAFGLSYIL